MHLDQEEIKVKALEVYKFWREDYQSSEEEAWKIGVLELALEKLGVNVQELYELNPEWEDFTEGYDPFN